MGLVEVRNLLRSLCEDDGITIIISSHILAELYQLVTDYIIISNGEIIDCLSKEELDEKCSSYVIIETPNPKEAIKVLKENEIKNIDSKNNSIKIYDDIETKKVAQILFDSKILVTLLMKYEKSLEEYYMELLGRK